MGHGTRSPVQWGACPRRSRVRDADASVGGRQPHPGIAGYQPHFAEAFGSPDITKERVAKAIADYERTRMSGNSAYDRWRRLRDAGAVSDAVKQEHDLFFGKGACHQCHVGSRFTDNTFHNIASVGTRPRKPLPMTAALR